MALPENITPITVQGRFIETPGGAPVAGNLTFTPAQPRLVDVAGQVILVALEPVEVGLDATGFFSVNLIPTNNPAAQPVNWTYTVQESFSSKKYSIPVPYDTAGGILDLVDVAPVDATTGQIVLVTSGTWRGLPVGGDAGQVLAKATDDDYDAEWIDAPSGGGSGDGTVTSVAGVDPDGTGNVPLTAADIDAATTEDLASGLGLKADTDDLDSLPYAKTVNAQGPDGSGDITLTAADVGALGTDATASDVGAAAVPDGITAGQVIGWDGTDTTAVDVVVIPSGISDGQALTFDGDAGDLVGADFVPEDGTRAPIIDASEPVIYRNETAGTYATRASVGDPARPAKWSGTQAPSAGGGYAKEGDFYRQIGS